jgi:cell division protein ZapA
MSRVEVSIMGQSYVLGSPDGEEEALRQAAARVDQAMCNIRDAGKIKARDRIAVLASLNLAFDLSKSPAPAPEAQPDAEAAPPAPASAAEAPAATPSRAQADDTATERPTGDEAQDQRLRDLIARLDQALQSDGRLL